MELEQVERLAKRFAKKHKVWEPEAIAEAYYLWVDYQHSITCQVYGMQTALVSRFIALRLYNYFNPKKRMANNIEHVSNGKPSKIEIFDYLSGYFGDDELANLVSKYVEIGLTLDEISFVSQKLKAISSRMARLSQKYINELLEQLDASLSTSTSLPSEPQDS
jgi:hypothetical protein